MKQSELKQIIREEISKTLNEGAILKAIKPALTGEVKEAVEINVLITGKMIINEKLLSPGNIFLIEKNEIADPEFLEDCTIVCVKTPSIPGDKYEVKE